MPLVALPPADLTGPAFAEYETVAKDDVHARCRALYTEYDLTPPEGVFMACTVARNGLTTRIVLPEPMDVGYKHFWALFLHETGHAMQHANGLPMSHDGWITIDTDLPDHETG